MIKFHRIIWSWSTHYKQGNISPGCSGNSEALASELLETIDEMFPRYYIRSDNLSMLKSATTQ